MVSRAKALSGHGATDAPEGECHRLLERRWRCVASAAQTWHWRGPFHQLETTMAQKPFKDITNRHLERGNQHIDSFDGSAGVGVDRRHAPP